MEESTFATLSRERVTVSNRDARFAASGARTVGYQRRGKW